MMGAAVLLDEFDPTGGEPLEVGGLRWIDDVVHDAGDHGRLRTPSRSPMAMSISGHCLGRKSAPSPYTSQYCSSPFTDAYPPTATSSSFQRKSSAGRGGRARYGGKKHATAERSRLYRLSDEPDLIVTQGGDQSANAGLGVVLGFVQDAIFSCGFYHLVHRIATGFLDQVVVAPDLEHSAIPIVESRL